ncbi:MAG TPA: hypothetical protein PLI83_05385 [Thermomonas sp.]|nr:hypothetical protein [Thermomonas sp.]
MPQSFEQTTLARVYSSHLSTDPMMSGSWWEHSSSSIWWGRTSRPKASTSGL